MKKIISILIASLFLPMTAFAAFPPFQIEQGGTKSSGPWSFYPLVGNATSSLIASSTLWLAGVNATSTTADSTFVHFTDTFGTTTNATSTNFSSTKAVMTNATTTNFFATTASTTNFWGGGLPGSGCSGLSSFLQWASGSFSCATLSTATWATTSQDYYNSLFRDWSLQGSPLYLAPTTTRAILVNNSTSTITNLLMVNSTSTNATTTAFSVSGPTVLANATTTNTFSTTASSTNLFSSKLSISTTTTPVNSGIALATSTVLAGAQFNNTISSTTASATQLVNWDSGNTQRIMLTAATNIVVNATSSNPRDGGKYILDICQDPTGSRTASFFPNALRWPTLGATPGATTTVSSTANSCTFIGMIYDASIGIYSVMGSTTGVSNR